MLSTHEIATNANVNANKNFYSPSNVKFHEMSMISFSSGTLST